MGAPCRHYQSETACFVLRITDILHHGKEVIVSPVSSSSDAEQVYSFLLPIEVQSCHSTWIVDSAYLEC